MLFSFPSLSQRGNATAWCQSRGVTRESQISTYAFFYPHLVFLHVVPLIITGFATSPELRKREGETYFLPLPAIRIDNRKPSQTEETCKQINELPLSCLFQASLHLWIDADTSGLICLHSAVRHPAQTMNSLAGLTRCPLVSDCPVLL